MSMTPQLETRKAELLPVPSLKTFLQIGSALYAELEKKIFLLFNRFSAHFGGRFLFLMVAVLAMAMAFFDKVAGA